MLSDRGRDLVIFMVVFNSTTFMSLGLRFYVLFFVKRRPVRIDDYIILLSAACLLAVEGAMAWGMSLYALLSLVEDWTLTVYLAIYYGLGFHTDQLPWPNIAVQIKVIVQFITTPSSVWGASPPPQALGAPVPSSSIGPLTGIVSCCKH